MDSRTLQKKLVGYEAAKRIKDGQVVGLGTGTTVRYFIEKLGEKIKERELDILGIPTSYQSFLLAKNCGIPLTTLEEHDVDIAIDGADEVDKKLNLIKGKGGAHTQEKIVDYSAKKFIVIVDESKIVDELGKSPVPVEVIPSSLRMVCENIKKLGGKPSLRFYKYTPWISDNGNFIIDVKFDSIGDPSRLEKELNNIPGVVENGIFSKNVDEVLVGTKNGIKVLK
ncbi:ribose-5-phosphate isomerase [Methanothermus fervidus DSM 2088]|uniref:Ribose-5-phosphate isomerase A n=1 Tax=Methanothermus fervidus (strain ATCC 43054 / DSM 2088 / JCM 10308 / V24 S) TaxID=523846 RepID=E3GWJ6_METFV|nr:ribose-5-phosphate isomerase RpiA [Methanothermus fervidus]ADP76810.1 ribose-5-phosphate isomerase [Methanothermus fervidus DSM 2088]